MAVQDLEQNGMTNHLLQCLKKGQSIGHYGQLVFAMVGRHFMEEDELIKLLKKDPDLDDDKARALVRQVEGRDYNPPRREKILQFMKEQDFPICPDANDPDACNVYKDLKFPQEVYEKIEQYREAKANA
jgi:DNA primase large subunit